MTSLFNKGLYKPILALTEQTVRTIWNYKSTKIVLACADTLV